MILVLQFPNKLVDYKLTRNKMYKKTCKEGRKHEYRLNHVIQNGVHNKLESYYNSDEGIPF